MSSFSRLKGRALRAARTYSGDEPTDQKFWQRNPFAFNVPPKKKPVEDGGESGLRAIPENQKLEQNNVATSSFEPNGNGDGATQRTDPEKIDAGTQDTASDSQLERDENEEEDKHGKETKWQSFKRRMFVENQIPAGQQIRTVLFPHWYTINWLLLCSPLGIGLHFAKVNPLAVFIVNFIAIIPLAGMLSNATEELALRVGEVLGGLLNASFGNAVELIVSIIALVKKEIILVQTSLIGSMLSNLLLVMGMCFYFGGLGREQQFFNETVAQTAASLLALSVGALIIPTAYTWQQNYDAVKGQNDEELSRGLAVILLFIYIAFLIFQLSSHKEMYNKKSQKVARRVKPPGKIHRKYRKAKAHMHMSNNSIETTNSDDSQDDDAPEEPSLTFLGALIVLCAATALIGVNAEFLVDSISEVTCQYHVSEVFVGLILLPIVGNAAEHATAVTVAIKDKMDLAIGVAVGSSMQIALFVLPLSVLIGWWIHADMTLVFDNFQIAVLFVAVILVNYLIADGASHWLEGMQLMCLYVIIAVAAWFFPQTNDGGAVCATG